jgi:hypothetical protein
MEWWFTTLAYTNLVFLSVKLAKTPAPEKHCAGRACKTKVTTHGNVLPLLPVVVGQITIQMDRGG